MELIKALSKQITVKETLRRLNQSKLDEELLNLIEIELIRGINERQ